MPSLDALSTRINSSGVSQASTRRAQSRSVGPLSAATTITLTGSTEDKEGEALVFTAS
jgi:hypothetical protein